MINCEGVAVQREVVVKTSHSGHGADVPWVLQE